MPVRKDFACQQCLLPAAAARFLRHLDTKRAKTTLRQSGSSGPSEMPRSDCDKTLTWNRSPSSKSSRATLLWTSRTPTREVKLTLSASCDSIVDSAIARSLIEVRTALIVVARIGLLRPIREGAPGLPFVATLLLAYGYGRVLAVFDNGPKDGAALPPGVVDYGGKRTLAADMRKFILEHLGNNNVLVGFHLAWTLTALSLSVPASRAVDLGSEPVFQELSCRMADDLPA